MHVLYSIVLYCVVIECIECMYFRVQHCSLLTFFTVLSSLGRLNLLWHDLSMAYVLPLHLPIVFLRPYSGNATSNPESLHLIALLRFNVTVYCGLRSWGAETKKVFRVYLVRYLLYHKCVFLTCSTLKIGIDFYSWPKLFIFVLFLPKMSSQI